MTCVVRRQVNVKSRVHAGLDKNDHQDEAKPTEMHTPPPLLTETEKQSRRRNEEEQCEER